MSTHLISPGFDPFWCGDQVIPATVELLGTDLSGGMYFDADYGVVLSGSDVVAWTSYHGSVTAYQPGYYGQAGLPPTLGALGSRKALDFASGNRAMILDTGASIFSGVNSTKAWSVIVQLSLASNGHVIGSGNSADTTSYVTHYLSTHMMYQADDAGTNGNVSSGTSISLATETIAGWAKNGTAHYFFQNGTGVAGNPFSKTIGQTTINQIAIGAGFRGASTWSSYINGQIRRLIITPGVILDAKQLQLARLWFGT